VDKVLPWIQTYSGKKFDLLNPTPESISIFDIAHALSNICRYTGHTKEFYSVAQHSVLASVNVPPKDALAGLLHDATEAYLTDISKPLKMLLPEYCKLEDKIYKIIAAKFGLPAELPASVKEADLRLLATEKRDLLEK
jgi:5'-deoxynucleotidase YfbR-like HD superfamily hydrolase